MRDALVTTLAACAGSWPSRWRTRRFLTGLSSDELQFIAEYLGSCVLGPAGSCPCPCAAPSRRMVPDGTADAGTADRWSHDREHKIILLLEFLGRTGMRHTSPLAPAARWN